MRINQTKAKLAAGATVYGCFVRYPEATLIEMLGYYGWDYLLLDAEHSSITPRDCEHLVRACELQNVTPIVRVTTNHPATILRFLDTGVQGAQIPMINSVDDAEAAVRAIKYHPFGQRGLAGVRAADFGQRQPFSFAQYTKTANEQTLVIAQIETIQAVALLPEIIKVPQIDVIFIGPTDLSHSMGLPGEINHPDVQAAFDRIIEIVQPTGIAIGTLVPDLAAAKHWQQRGARFLMITMEALLGPACRQFLAAARQT